LTGAAGFLKAHNILEESRRLLGPWRNDFHMRELCDQTFDHEILR